jgi:SAM-dependent methyltransferase
MPSSDSAPFNGDDKLHAKESRAYFRYGWQEIKAGREPDDLPLQQAGFAPLQKRDARSPYRVLADTLMQQVIDEFLATPATIVDIGCGPGLYAQLFKDRAGHYHGVDVVDYPQWDAARQSAQGWPLDVDFHPIPAEEVGSLNIQADFSLSSSALEHVNDPDAVARGLAQIMKPGSYGLHIVPAPWSLLTYGKHGWRRFSAKRLKTMFEEAGFECVRIVRLGGTASTLLHFLWITGLQDGAALQNATLSGLPYILYRINSLIRFPGARTNRISNAIYRPLLRWALRIDVRFRKMPSGYAIVIEKLE